MTDPDWFGVTFLAGFIIVLVRSFLVPSSSSLIAWAVIIGVLETIAKVLLDPETPMACIGFVMFPIVYWITGQVGRLLRRFIWDVLIQRHRRPPVLQ